MLDLLDVAFDYTAGIVAEGIDSVVVDTVGADSEFVD